MTEQPAPAAVESEPLTAAARVRPLLEIVPLPFWLLMLALLFVLLNTFIGRVPVLLIAFVLVAILVFSYTSMLWARDLPWGVVLVRDDVLERTWSSGARGGGRCRALPRVLQPGEQDRLAQRATLTQRRRGAAICCIAAPLRLCVESRPW